MLSIVQEKYERSHLKRRHTCSMRWLSCLLTSSLHRAQSLMYLIYIALNLSCALPKRVSHSGIRFVTLAAVVKLSHAALPIARCLASKVRQTEDWELRFWLSAKWRFLHHFMQCVMVDLKWELLLQRLNIELKVGVSFQKTLLKHHRKNARQGYNSTFRLELTFRKALASAMVHGEEYLRPVLQSF